jgi:hypothetical protein
MAVAVTGAVVVMAVVVTEAAAISMVAGAISIVAAAAISMAEEATTASTLDISVERATSAAEADFPIRFRPKARGASATR